MNGLERLKKLKNIKFYTKIQVNNTKIKVYILLINIQFKVFIWGCEEGKLMYTTTSTTAHPPLTVTCTLYFYSYFSIVIFLQLFFYSYNSMLVTLCLFLYIYF